MFSNSFSFPKSPSFPCLPSILLALPIPFACIFTFSRAIVHLLTVLDWFNFVFLYFFCTVSFSRLQSENWQAFICYIGKLMGYKETQFCSVTSAYCSSVLSLENIVEREDLCCGMLKSQEWMSSEFQTYTMRKKNNPTFPIALHRLLERFVSNVLVLQE